MALQQLALVIYKRFNYNNNKKKHQTNVWNNSKNIFMWCMLLGIIWHQNILKYAQADESIQQQHEENKFTGNQMPIYQMDKTTKTVKKQLGKYQQQELNVEQVSLPFEQTKTVKSNDNKILNEKNSVNITRHNIKQEHENQEKQVIHNSIKLDEIHADRNRVQNNHLYSSSQLYHFKENLIDEKDDVSDSLKPGFYFFLALSVIAVFVILFKIHRLRLSKAERKYGVHGDHTMQELTPLPMAIDDGHSDDDYHTLFDVQRQELRIF